MCGICGIASPVGRPDPDRLAAMSAALVHRGPDQAGEHLDGPVALAARRLSIIDLAGGDQPIANEDGSCVVVQNGEIYNSPELRRELERAGHRFRTHCDTEVLVHLYEEHDLDFARRLRGMFAVAIWDARRRRLVLTRDRFGIKPLYYRHVGGELAFASELRALPRGEIDVDALEAFLAFNSIPAPYSIFREIRKLPAGHTLVWEGDGRILVDRYARPAPASIDELRDDDEAELLEELRARLRDSVRAHLLSDVPVGVLLSGGVDSAALAALAAQESRDPVHTFTIGFAERSFDERDDARLVAERYGTDHHELLVKPDPTLLLPALADAFDEPFADSSALPTYLVSELAARHVKVALSGEGGDELFGGYYTYAADLLADRFAPLARLARPAVERLPTSTSKASFDYKAKRFVRAAHLPPLERHHGWKEIFSADARTELTGRSATFDPVDVVPRALPRDRGRRPACATAGRRLRDLPRRRPAREDRPRVDGALAGSAGAVPRSSGYELCLRAADEAQGARPVEEGAAPQGGRAAPPARGRARQEARLLDPGGGMAARRPRAVRARDAFGRHGPAAGILPAGDGLAADRRPRRRRRGPEPPAVGSARVHALVRAARRAGAAAPQLRPDGGAARVSDYPPFGLGYPRTELRRQLVDAVLAGEKTSTSGLAEEYAAEGEAVPVAGDRFLLEGFDEEPIAIVEVTEARVVPASEIDVQFARDEGEGFESVDDWRVAHETFFGRPIRPETEIVAIRFRVVEVLA